MNKISKAFKVTIRKQEYDVYNIDGKEHPGYNDIPKTWWLYFSNPLPEGLFPPIDSEDLIPYCKSIERRLWDIKFTQNTSHKIKWDEHRFSSNTHCEMWCNGRLIYSFETCGGDRGLAFAMAKVQYLQVHLAEHPFNFFSPEEENGRKICWYGLPATIKVSRFDSWEIKIIPDYAEIKKEDWWKELSRRTTNFTKKDDDDLDMDEMENEDNNEYKNSDCINWGDALSDQYIYWFRK